MSYISIHITARVNGGWGTWSEWSSCSSTCETGETERTRKCDDPRPRNGGKRCRGVNKEYKSSTVETDPSKYWSKPPSRGLKHKMKLLMFQ